jgi:hypothetical protein
LEKGQKGCRFQGIMEHWNSGMFAINSIIPLFQHSNTGGKVSYVN